MVDLSELTAAEALGMATSFWAQRKPDAVAAYDRFGLRTFRDVNANANRIVRLLRRQGIVPGAHVAFACTNRMEAMEIMAACLRGGYRLVPVSWRLTAGETAYILQDCNAAAMFVEARFNDVLEGSRQMPLLRLAIDADIEGFIPLQRALEDIEGSDIPDPVLGSTMLYTSGTTGRPKGVYREKLALVASTALSRYNGDNDIQLCVCPIYHGSGLSMEMRPAMTAGVPVVFQDHWDSREVLRQIQERRITHAHFVPIMFQRLLATPERLDYDVSSLRYVMHGAAPCSVEVKRAIIDWLGPIVHEYYASAEIGLTGFWIDSSEWLRKPGSVGKRPSDVKVRILDATDNDCPQGIDGRIYFERPPSNSFSYYKDPQKTAACYLGTYYTVGDIGHFDADDYLFLTGRSADCIISGGVNIYPQEIDNEIMKHPAVEDVATVGVPNAEWGEEVKAVVSLRPGWIPSPTLAAEIIASVRGQLAGFKCPRSVDFVDSLPRNAVTKIERAKVRARYWAGRKSQI
jgi:long-chain acyl-CoA synthetase